MTLGITPYNGSSITIDKMITAVNIYFSLVGIAFSEKEILRHLSLQNLNPTGAKGKTKFENVRFSDLVVSTPHFAAALRLAPPAPVTPSVAVAVARVRDDDEMSLSGVFSDSL